MNSAIVFFSKDGNTKIAATLLNQRFNGKIIELNESKKGNVIQAVFKKESKLEGTPWEEIKENDTIYLMQPVWGNNGVPAMNAFIKNADFIDKKVYIITFQASKGLKSSDKIHDFYSKQVENKGGKVVKCYAFIGANIGHCLEEEKMEEQVKIVEPV
jgi:flavodoxin